MKKHEESPKSEASDLISAAKKAWDDASVEETTVPFYLKAFMAGYEYAKREESAELEELKAARAKCAQTICADCGSALARF
jgi:hypothetical protein